MATVADPASVLLPGHDVPLGRYTTVRRLLPQRSLRMIGAWCFVDHFGPDDVSGRPGMSVGPHPHTGLQTVTWLVDGEVLHRDSLGSLARIRPGEVNLMSAGRGIAHSEESPVEHPPVIHGLQLWVALPESARHGEPRFDHHPQLPTFAEAGMSTTVVAGEMAGHRSPALVHTPLVGAQIMLAAAAGARIPLERDFEYGVLAMNGTARVADADLSPGSLLYLGRGRTDLTLRSEDGARLFLLGGEPFDEPLVMWWNFVARTHDEMVQAREDWQAGRRFGEVTGFNGDRLPAPTMPTTRIKARYRDGRTV
ncbi:pirin family protein [Rugosimonospora acidiphila]|uniref:pirin family protein n=1 Tax=Rugosimonospora acidiphila TaxID=556531 RepID=UPI0031EB652F